jgi:serine/threonine-protein kinase RsbW
MRLRQASADEQVVIRRWGRDPRSVATARGELLNALAHWGLGEISDSAAVVLSELLTNAQRHACASPEGKIETRFLRTGDRLRIEVHDGSEERPVPRLAGVEALDGRGLFLVAVLADSWDVLPREDIGKIVWAEWAVPPREDGCDGT